MPEELTQQKPAASAVPAVRTKPSLLNAMAARYNIEPAKFLATLKATVMPSNKPVSDEELQAFCMVAHEYGLNPFTKEIYAFPDKRGGITPVVSVDGWISLMNRRAEFDGIEFDAKEDETGKPYSVTAKIHVKGRSRPVCVTEYFAECQRQTDPWRTSPRRMLRHKALIQGARVAFGFSGIHDEDDASAMINVTPAETARPIFGATRTATQALPEVEVVPAPATPPEDQVPGAEVPPVAAQPAPVPAPAPEPGPATTPQSQLAAAVGAEGLTFTQFLGWASAQGFVEATLAGWADVPEKVAARLLRSKVGMVNAIRANGGAR